MRWLLPEGCVRSDGSVRKDWAAYMLALPAVDAAAVACALALAYWMRVVGDRLGDTGLSAGAYLVLAALVLAAWLAAARMSGLYKRERLLAGTDEYARVVQASTSLAVGIALADVATASDVADRSWLFPFWISLTVFAGLSRMLARRLAFAARRRGAFTSRVIIVGADDRAVQLARHLTEPGNNVLGFLDDYRPLGSRVGTGGWPVFGAASDLALAEQLGADEVIIVPSAVSWESRRTILEPAGCRAFDIRVLADREDALTAGIRVSHRSGVPMYALEDVRLTGLEAAAKRAFDLTVAIALLAVVGPFALARIAGTAARGRSVIERHRLIGARGKPMTVRTLPGDGNRIVSKLPAVFNVLRGDMSIVGPVPVAESSTAALPAELRLMKPGLTSVVWTDRGNVGEASATAIQVEYVRNYSIWRDLQVLWHRALAAGRTMPRPAAGSIAIWELAGQPATQAEQKR